jgi:Fe-S cluster biogenesis protein NfuA
MADRDLHDPLARVDELIRTLEAADPRWQAVARELVQALLEFHRRGLAKLLEIVSQSGKTAEAIREACTHDDLVGQLLMLHGLHPKDLETRVRDALDQVRPKLLAFGADVELLDIADHALRLRLTSDCQSRPSSIDALKRAVAEAICGAASDVAEIEFVSDKEPHGQSSARLLRLPVLNHPG